MKLIAIISIIIIVLWTIWTIDIEKDKSTIEPALNYKIEIEEQRKEQLLEEAEQHKPKIGMTYTGKLGVEVTPGVVMPFDGSGITFGYGF